ncbi:LTA synthase family protein, partial [Novosphingobium sp. 1949]|nr:LTA synthase family protein [Novosphingobium organovorum]
MIILSLLVGVLGAAALVDGLVRPRGVRKGWGLWLGALVWLSAFGAFLALSGNPQVAAALALAMQAVLALASNAKRAVLGEPLLFSDLALIGALFRHPQFYFSALKAWQKRAAGIVALALLAGLVLLFVPAPAPHLAGLGLALGGVLVLAGSLRLALARGLAARPDAEADLARL